MSSSSDPQTWIFPPSGSAKIPSIESPSAGFGPVTRSDKIRLEWAPADQRPRISMICANDGTTFTISPGGNPSPYTYTFTQSVNNGTSHICWLFFPGTTLGNAVTFSYQNTPSSTTSQSTTWRQSNQLALAAAAGAAGAAQKTTITQTVTSPPNPDQTTTSTTSTTPPPGETTAETQTTTRGGGSSSSSSSSTSSSSTIPLLAASSSSSTPNSAPQANTHTNTNSTPGIGIGMIVGITIGATLLSALLCALGVWMMLRVRRDKHAHAKDGQGAWKDLSLPSQVGMQMGVVAGGTGVGVGEAACGFSGGDGSTSGMPRRTIHEIQG